jgi:hypothetical protein
LPPVAFSLANTASMLNSSRGSAALRKFLKKVGVMSQRNMIPAVSGVTPSHEIEPGQARSV